MTTTTEGRAKRVRIYVDEGDMIGHQAAHIAIVQFLRKANCAGATVFRGAEGFGGAGELHTSRIVDIFQRLPLVIEWIDSPERVDALLGRVKEMMVHGFITVDPTDIVLHVSHSVRLVSARLSAGDVMSRDVTTVESNDPIVKIVNLLHGKVYRAVPVVEGGKPVGIITNSDLVNRGGLGVRVDLLPSLADSDRERHLDPLASSQKTAREIMTPDPVTVHVAAPLPHVAEVMTRRHLKRLPVTDDEGRLMGIVSRVDLLRSVGEGFSAQESERPDEGLNGDMPLARIVRSDVPTVYPDTPVQEALQAVISTRLNRAVVVDRERCVVGLITDAEMLERVTPSLRPGILRSLMHRLPFVRPSQETLAAEHHAAAHVASDLMNSNVLVLSVDASVREATLAMLKGSHKLAAVVDKDKHLMGVVDRADLLRGLVVPI